MIADIPLVITGAPGVPAGLTSSVKVALPVPPALVALRLTKNVPAVDGLPLIKPVPVSTVNPAGSPIALKLVGELIAVI